MPNRLAKETSPYLLQHQNNPVDWWPWCDEAFAEAKRRDVAVFLSVGYSACHWCHVMEHESFESDAIAKVMNDNFVCVKVDREERPDVDQIYMTAVQMMTGRGGWPMSVFMTPDGKPFYGGTYWPPTSRMGMPGFKEILERVADAYRSRRDDVLKSSSNLTEAINAAQSRDFGGAELSAETLENATAEIVASADRKHGGFGPAPKFPHPMDIRVLLRGFRRFGDPDALGMAQLTLDKMAGGGMYDHLGGGFHRYSTDAIWLVPHFEKMLYDQALLVPAYVEAWQITGDETYSRIVRETLDYVIRELRLPGGGIAATQDADSDDGSGHKEEGAFFVWSIEQIREHLGDQADRFAAFYDVTTQGNWEGHCILNTPEPDEETHAALAQARSVLFEARTKRIPPGRDDKVITAWNGLLISAAAFAGRVLGESKYIDLAEEAADFVLGHLVQSSGRLYHCYKDEQAKFDGFLDDYAALIEGLCELYQARSNARHYQAAVELAERMQELFADPNGGYFYTAVDGEALVTRPKDVQDSAVPSGNALAATALLKLGMLAGDPKLLGRSADTLASMSGLLAEHPRATGQSLIALSTRVGPAYELVFAGGDDLLEPTWREANRRFLPNAVLLRSTGDSAVDDTEAAAPISHNKPPIDGQPTLYVCTLGACERPVVGAAAISERLKELA